MPVCTFVFSNKIYKFLVYEQNGGGFGFIDKYYIHCTVKFIFMKRELYRIGIDKYQK